MKKIVRCGVRARKRLVIVFLNYFIIIDEVRAKGYIYLPPNLKHPQSNDEFYPVEFDKVIYDCFQLKVIFDRERTGFEETKEFPIVINSIIAGRY